MSLIRKKDALDYHARGRPGKIEVVPTKPCTTQRDLVARLLARRGRAVPRDRSATPSTSYKYTAQGQPRRRRSPTAPRCSGSATSAPLAAKPVMEGKALLFKRFADIDVFDIELGRRGSRRRHRSCLPAARAHLRRHQPRGHQGARVLLHRGDAARADEDPGLPRRPARHRDHLRRRAAQRARDRRQGDRPRCRSSSPAPARPPIACAEHYVRLGVRRENIIMCDTRGVIYEGRDARTWIRTRRASPSTRTQRTLAEALVGADVFVGLSVGRRRHAARWCATMAAQPDHLRAGQPGSRDHATRTRVAARPDAIVATGRSDYPNQVNNVLGFPFIFRGALDVARDAPSTRR